MVDLTDVSAEVFVIFDCIRRNRNGNFYMPFVHKDEAGMVLVVYE